MNQLRIVVAGTGTGIGKTVFCAGLVHLLGANFWKPIQAGLEGETDAERVARLGSVPSDRIVPERYRLQTAVSPHCAAEVDDVRIDTDSLEVPDIGAQPLVIEGTGGLMEPLTCGTLYIDLFERWRLPVVLCASTAPGTVNCSLLSIEALRRRQIDMLGIVFVGEKNPDAVRAICEIGRVRWLGRLPWIAPLTADTLQAGFKASFRRDDFTMGLKKQSSTWRATRR
ncbi:dethiobiotin synthase [Bradyrhizobium brasilense]|uniref:dethiobiotin synthase n=1 Tax=Bradyrhizobium brasilense TaxID=1419277 RepID=UPI0024B2171A|nr:dethiobiotin synthase [Bradyrhizobium australafricanum]WFU31505.1 dethiobiotin synthase [Bradyrhizobium australafricanum]